MSKLPSGRPLWLFAVALMLADVSYALEANAIFAALAAIQREFADPAMVGWLVTGYLLISAGTTAVAGRLGDLYGRKRVLLIVLAIAGVGSLISALATDLHWVIAGRCVQGLAAAIAPLCYGLVREHVAPRLVPLFISLIVATAAFATGAGFIVGGHLVDTMGWNAIFYVTALCILAGMIGVASFVPRSRSKPIPGRIDVLGGVLFMPAVAGLLFGVTKGSVWGWLDPRTLGLFGASLMVLVIWARIEYTREHALINVRLLGNRRIALANGCLILMGFGAMQYPLVMMLLLQQPVWTGIGLGLSATVAGLLKTPSSVIAGLGATMGAPLLRRYGGRTTLIIAGVGLCVGMIAFGLMHDSFVGILCASTLLSVFSAMVSVAITTVVTEASPSDRASEATGLSAVLRTTGQAIGAQLVATLLATSHASSASAAGHVFPPASAYYIAIAFMFCTTLAMLATAIALPKPPGPQPKRAPVVMSPAAAGRPAGSA